MQDLRHVQEQWVRMPLRKPRRIDANRASFPVHLIYVTSVQVFKKTKYLP